MEKHVVDLLVVGGGMAGLTAAARATRDGLSVLVVEAGDAVGGNARYAGYAWTAPDQEVMDTVNPEGDPRLRAALVDRFTAGVEWIRSTGVTCHDAVPILGFGRGHQFDTNHYIDTCRRLIVEGGGQLWLQARVTELRWVDDSVSGGVVRRADATEVQVDASSTLLATGGFQADSALVDEHVGPRASGMPLRSGPASDGGGYRLATALGAATGGERAGFYGHLIPSGIEFQDPADFVDLSLYYSEHALLFDLDSERFTDETLGDHLTTMALLDRPESRGLLIADQRVFRDWVIGSYVEGAVSVDKYALASRRGGRVGLAEEIEELAFLPEEWGYDGQKIADAVRDFNTRTSNGDPVTPGRRHDPSPLDEGPWYVVECVPAITFPFHGVRIDDQARVLDTSGRAIPGLLCAGSDTGGLWNRTYAGGIASALVFGLTAAETAARTSSGTADTVTAEQQEAPRGAPVQS